MDISELLDTGRDEKIASNIANMSSLFSTATQQRKASLSKKVKVAKVRRRCNRRTRRRAISEDTTTDEKKPPSKASHILEEDHLVEISINEEENYIFQASSNPANKRTSSRKMRICSESTTDKFSSSSHCVGIQEFLLPVTATSSLKANTNQFRGEFSPSKLPSDDPCTFEEDDILGLGTKPFKPDTQKTEKIKLSNTKGKTLTFTVFKEDEFPSKTKQKLLAQLIENVTYDEDQSSDDGIVQDGVKKAKTFLVKNIKSFVQAAISTYSASK